MSLSIRTNVPALFAQRHVNLSNERAGQTMESITSSTSINEAGDDAAGLQIANRLSAQLYGLDVVKRNANEGISLMQVAEGSMNETTSVLQRMRDLALQSSNGVNTEGDRRSLQEEVIALNDEINRIAETTSFAGQKLLNGTYGKLESQSSFQLSTNSGEAVIIGLKNMRSDAKGMGGQSYISSETSKDWQVKEGKNQLFIDYKDATGDDQRLTIEAKVGDDIEELATYINGQTDQLSSSVNEDGQLQFFMSNANSDQALSFSGNMADELGMESLGKEYVHDVDITSVGGAQRAVAVIDAALKYVDGHRAELGAQQNRFQHAMNDMDNMSENVSASRARITDTDYAKASTQLVKEQFLQQAGNSVLAQAKNQPNMALSLLS